MAVPSNRQVSGQPNACMSNPETLRVWGGVLRLGGANRAHDGCAMHRTPGCPVGSRCVSRTGWEGFPLCTKVAMETGHVSSG